MRNLKCRAVLIETPASGQWCGPEVAPNDNHEDDAKESAWLGISVEVKVWSPWTKSCPTLGDVVRLFANSPSPEENCKALWLR